MINKLLEKAPAILTLVAALFFAVQAISGLSGLFEAARGGLRGTAETFNVLLVTLVTAAFQPAILLGLAAIAHHLAKSGGK